MTTKNTCCGSCGNCRENGRLWVEGYHGKNSLNFTTDSALIQNVAAFHDYGFNLSECCAPVIKATPKNITDLLLKPAAFSESRLTTDLNELGFILDDTTPITAVASSFAAASISTGFEAFFDSTPYAVQLQVCGGIDVVYTVTTSGTAGVGPFITTVNVSYQKGGVELATTKLVSDAYTLSTTSNVAVNFTPTSVGSTLILGDSIFTYTQFPTFTFEPIVDLTNDTVVLRLTNHFYASCKQNTLSSFLVCNDAANCVG